VFFIPVARDQLFPALVAGKGDIAAANLTITSKREKLVDFSAPAYTNVSQLVVSGSASPKLSSCVSGPWRAHARSADPGMIAGYMGASAAFDDAIGEFAMEYADQNERDYRAFVTAVKEGRIEAIADV